MTKADKHLITYLPFPAVYYEEPEPEPETEEQLATSSPTEARERRDILDIPEACRTSSGRMKRSCVIIPPPPPKPTTASKQEIGTKPPNEDFQGNTFNSNDTEHYFIRVFSSNCLYWDENTENWINKGCKASVEQCVLVAINAVVDDDDDHHHLHHHSGIIVVVVLVFVRQDACYVM